MIPILPIAFLYYALNYKLECRPRAGIFYYFYFVNIYYYIEGGGGKPRSSI